MNDYRYSPLPIEDYYVNMVGMTSVATIAKLDLSEAIWNMVWLSMPQLDNLPGSGKDWHKVFTTTPGLQAALVTDVYEDEVLYRKLLMPPHRFLEWWKREDHTIYDAYEIGGKEWAVTVTQRAEEATVRMSKVKNVKDNVIAVKFGRAA